MKTRFSTIDIRAAIAEIQKYLGMRLANVYDVDHKTYLFKLAKPDEKVMILMESGSRIHTTDFEWPKSMMPSGFSMKLRKHLRTRRLEKVEQLGIDRIVDLQFGSGEAAYHVILELYDRGNIVLTDFEYMILNILRPRTDDSQDVRFAVREKYPVELAKHHTGLIPEEKLRSIFLAAKEGDNLRKILNPQLEYGPAVIDHCLQKQGFLPSAKLGTDFNVTQDIGRMLTALDEAETLLKATGTGTSKGYIIMKTEKKSAVKEGDPTEIQVYQEFHPFLFKQHEHLPYTEFELYNKAVDEFFSKMESQKLDLKTLQQEKTALKKLENIRKDHEKRIETLQQEQDVDAMKAQLLEMNLDLVDRAIMVVQSALANQIDWTEIGQLVKEAQSQGDPVASAIKTLKLESNHMTMLLKDPYGYDSDEEDSPAIRPMKVDIDLGFSAYSNARRYFDMKRHAAKKEQKTLDASGKALKSAERKTKQTLKEVAVTATINKARKTYWFEKFLWFVSSENYLVIGGRDQQQNEIIVKRHMKPGDLYVHADLHGASSCIIKNPGGEPVPPKTLNEAGVMAVCNSAAWDAKVVTSAWWVYHNQVSKTAPTGEYLSTGSFMIRGKKNFLPPCYLVYGFGFLFRLEEDSIFRHKGERRVRTTEEDTISVATESITNESEMNDDIAMEGSSDSESDGEDTYTESTDSGRSQNSTATLESDTSHNAAVALDSTTVEKEVLVKEDNFVSSNSHGKETSVCENKDKVKHSCMVEDVDAQKKVHEKLHSSISESSDILQTVKSEADSSWTSSTEGKSKLELETISGVIQTVDSKTLTEEESAQKDNSFPDTNIQLQHVKGDMYTLQRSISSQSQDADDDYVIHLGDGKPIVLGANTSKPEKSGVKMSAKQRREMKKRAKQQQLGMTEQEETAEEDSKPLEPQVIKPEEEHTNIAGPSVTHTQAAPLKRGQKAKLKKMKDRYGDQDEEERQMKMQILASAGGPKEGKGKGKKGKKGKGENQQQKGPQAGQKSGVQSLKVGQQQRPPSGRKTAADIMLETLTIADKGDTMPEAKQEVDDGNVSDEEKAAVLEEENIRLAEDANTLDSLTGMPIPEDELLYAVPVVAPYSALNNYKFKVKLIPGTTKRGKAAKTTLQVFMQDKNATPREKELLRTLKDADLSRNIPGKVKVSAPNLHKHKGK